MTPREQQQEGYPWDSITRNGESEIVWFNIIKILARTKNVWRTLDWDEYKEERLKDKHFSDRERMYFDNVLKWTESNEACEKFRQTEKKLLKIS
jgi:hypothetical protein